MVEIRKSLLILILLLPAPAVAQKRTIDDPYGAYQCAKAVIRQSTTRAIKGYIAAARSGANLPGLTEKDQCESGVELRRYLVENKGWCSGEAHGPGGEKRGECGDWQIGRAHV